MKISTFTLALFAAAAGSAIADTMYKCTDANGKITFTSQPCGGKSKERTLNVVAPQSDAVSARRAEDAAEKLSVANEEFKKRAAERERVSAEERRQEAQAAQARADRLRWAHSELLKKEWKESEEGRNQANARRRAERDRGISN